MLSASILNLPLYAVNDARNFVSVCRAVSCWHSGICGICSRDTIMIAYVSTLNIDLCMSCHTYEIPWGVACTKPQQSLDSINDYLRDLRANLPGLITVARRGLVALSLAGRIHARDAPPRMRSCAICTITSVDARPYITDSSNVDICDCCILEAQSTCSNICYRAYLIKCIRVDPAEISDRIYEYALQILALEAIL